MAYAERRGRWWRVKYKKPDGSWASESGFETKDSALSWGRDQESDIRRNTWIDPGHAKERFGPFAEEVFAAVRVSATTRAKYRSHLDQHLLPQWEHWSLGAILAGYLDIEQWVKDLHKELSEPSVASVFASFSKVMEAAVKARKLPANPARGVRITSGEYEPEHQVATPLQTLRAAMRLHESFGHTGFVLALLNFYTGARWSEQIGLGPHDYDELRRAIAVRTPLTEAGGHLHRRKRTKTPAGKRWIQLPSFLHALHTELIASCEGEHVFTGPQGGVLRRGNFRARFWRPAWDGAPTHEVVWMRRPLLPGVTFNEAGRHSLRTQLAAAGVPEVARAARLGHRVPGMARVYEHVTPQMEEHVLSVLASLWAQSVAALAPVERERLFSMAPSLGEHYHEDTKNGLPQEPASKVISQISPSAG